MTPLNDGFWKSVAAAEAAILGSLILYGWVRIQSLEIQAASQAQIVAGLSKNLDEMNDTLSEIKKNQDKMMLAYVQAGIISP